MDHKVIIEGLKILSPFVCYEKQRELLEHVRLVTFRAFEIYFTLEQLHLCTFSNKSERNEIKTKKVISGAEYSTWYNATYSAYSFCFKAPSCCYGARAIMFCSLDYRLILRPTGITQDKGSRILNRRIRIIVKYTEPYIQTHATQNASVALLEQKLNDDLF